MHAGGTTLRSDGQAGLCTRSSALASSDCRLDVHGEDSLWEVILEEHAIWPAMTEAKRKLVVVLPVRPSWLTLSMIAINLCPADSHGSTAVELVALWPVLCGVVVVVVVVVVVALVV